MRASSVAGAAFALTCSASLHAKDWQVQAGTGVVYDSNVFRLDSFEEPPGNTKRSDIIVEANSAGNLKVPVSLQRLRLDGRVSRRNYLRHDDLSHTAYRGDIALDYRLNRIVSGSVGTAFEQRLSDFDYIDRIRNLERLRQPFFTMRSDTGARLFARGEIRKYILRNSNDLVRASDYVSDVVAGGLGYELHSGGLAALGVRTTRFDYRGDPTGVISEQPIGDSRQLDIEATIATRISGKTRINARAALIRRRYDELPGVTDTLPGGMLDIDYRATPVTSVRILIERAIAGPELRGLGGAIVTREFLSASWQPRTYVNGEAYFENRKRNFDQRRVAAEDDVTTRFGARFSYRAKLGSNAEVGVFREAREREGNGRDYRTTVAQLRVTLVI